MAVHGNNVLAANHFHKDWQRRVRTWFDQAGRKKARRTARQQKAAKLGARPTDLLRPAVRCPSIRYNTKIREGRGFSIEEVKAAGIRKKEALSLGICVDHRARSRSEERFNRNVERLQAYKARLVVFPRNSKKSKKGDSTGDDLKAETTNVLSAAFPLPPSSVAEKPRAITQEEKDFNAYATLRKEQSDARYVGVRAKRIAAKEEAEAAKAK
ncbi:60S ribosomal protein L13 [Cystobasidiomycetes sp. EMM_F5]